MTKISDIEQSNTATNNKGHEDNKSAWLTVAGSFLVYFVTFGYINSFGFFQDYYLQHDLATFSPSVISLIGSLQLGLLYLIAPISGTLADALEIRWLYLVAGTGGVLSCIGVSFAQPGQIWQYFLSQGVLFGLTVPFGTSVALSMVARHFPNNHRALAMGIVAGGSSAGGVCLPIMFAHLVPRIGFAWSLRVVALIMVFCYGVAISISTRKTPPKPLNMRKIVDFGGFKDIRYAMLALANVVGGFGLYVPFYYIEPYIALEYPGTSIGTYLLPLINGSSFFGRIIGGFTADRIGGLNILYIMTTISGILCLTMWLLAPNVGIVVAFACLYGFCSGVFISAIPPVAASLSPEDKIGARLGAFTLWGAIGVFTGTPIGGAFVKGSEVAEYAGLIIYTGVCVAAAGALLFVTRLLCDKNLRRKW